MWIPYSRCVLQDGHLQAAKFCSRSVWNPRLFLDCFFLHWSIGFTFYHYFQSRVISEIKKLGYSDFDNCATDICSWMRSADALSRCLCRAFCLSQVWNLSAGVPWSTMDRATWNTWGSLLRQKQSKFFLQLEVVSIWSAWNLFGSWILRCLSYPVHLKHAWTFGQDISKCSTQDDGF